MKGSPVEFSRRSGSSFQGLSRVCLRVRVFLLSETTYDFYGEKKNLQRFSTKRNNSTSFSLVTVNILYAPCVVCLLWCPGKCKLQQGNKP